MTLEKVALSGGSGHGLPILVAATAIGSGTTIHTATSSTTGYDEIWLWVSNTHTSAVPLTLGWGGTTDPDHVICNAVSIPPNSGPIPIVSGLILRNSLVVKAAGGTTNELLISGYVNRGL